MRILLVEDDAAFAEELLEILRFGGFVVDRADCAAQARQFAADGNYSAILLDLGLPDGDGNSLLREWRAAGDDRPVLIITARSTWTDKVNGFQAGADDYLLKPFRPQELVFRLRSIVRRVAGTAPVRVTCGPLGYDPVHGEFDFNGTYLDLTSLEWRILTSLMLNRGRVVSRNELLDQMYERGGDPSSNSLDVLLGRLRRKIGSDLIRTIRGRGYVLSSGEPDPQHGGDGGTP